MSCPRRDDLYRFPWPGITDDERDVLRQHSSNCAVCRRTIERLEAARQNLAAEAVAVHPSVNVATWEAIETKTRRSRAEPASGWIWAGAAAMTVAAIVLWSPRPEPPKAVAVLPADQTILVTDRRTFRDDHVTVHAEPDVSLTFGPLSPIRHLRLDRGRIVLDVAPLAAPATVIVATPALKVQGVGTVFTVEVDDDTTVDVARGRVRVTTLHGAPFDLVSGQTFTSKPEVAEPEPVENVVPKRPPKPRGEPVRRTSKPDNRSELARARRLVRHDAEGARRIADAVLSRAPRGVDEVDALAVIADAHRRDGASRQAADYYGRVAAHPDGGGYAEEALLWRARVSMDAGEPRAALDAIDTANRRFERGVLGPERRALAVAAWLRLGQPERAADLLTDDPKTLATQTAAVDVAKELLTIDPIRAAKLLRAVRSSSAPASLKTRAAALEKTLVQK